ASIFLNEGLPRMPGELLIQKDLAETFKLIAANGIDEFYTGSIAEDIINDIQNNGGYLNKSDLENFAVKIRTPLKGNYQGYEIYSPYLPSAGGMQVIQILNVLENYNLKKLGHNSPEYIHLLAEVFKQSFADRNHFAGDPEFADVPIEDIISKNYAKDISKTIDMEKPQYDYRPYGSPEESISTSHLSVIDGQGNIVAATQTINHFFGSGVAVPGRGFLLNDEMADFSNLRDNPNCIAPNKKPVSSMTPTIILKDGKPFLTVGSPGASRIISALVQIIVNLVDFDMSLDQAIEAPRVHSVTRKLYVEGILDIAVIEALKTLGHSVEVRGEKDLYFGGAQGILKDPSTGKLIGGADSRRDGFARGY
ncbi:MAG: gamma-glutamyltransferase, partial [bacterium]|nr:gamma-glutamyltransferase [bacterium]